METAQVRIPIGQQLVKAGFPEITRRQIKKRLDCDEIAKLENDLIKQRAQERCDQLNRRRRIFKCKVVEYVGTYYITYPSTELKGGLTSLHDDDKFEMVECRPKYIRLDSYAKQEIPAEALLKLEQARQIGLSHFWVVYPELRPKGDPIIVGKVTDKEDDNTYFFVYKW